MDKIKEFSKIIVRRLASLGVRAPRISLVEAILHTVHAASLVTEEGRFIQGSVTCADSQYADADAPSRRRADYPSFTRFDIAEPFTPTTFAKMARAVDKWSGSVAVWGTSRKDLSAWGIVDQLVGTNVSLNRESIGGFGNPGLFTVVIDRPGDFTVYHSRIFLGALRSQSLELSETDALSSPIILRKIIPHLMQYSEAIGRALPGQPKQDAVLKWLVDSWTNTVARICIGLRRNSTGGSLLISGKPKLSDLSIGYGFRYTRLRDAAVLQVLDDLYLSHLDRYEPDDEGIDSSDTAELSFATTDAKDREDELGGAVKLVTSLAALDGALLLSPDLDLHGFAIKIRSAHEPGVVYDGSDFSRRGRKAKTVDLRRFGTRHSSVISYCRADPHAIGIIISQDGHVRVAATEDEQIVLWDRIQLLNRRNYTAAQAKAHRRHITGVRRSRELYRVTLGYSAMPKTVADLLSSRTHK